MPSKQTTMKVTQIITKQEKVEIEIELPYFFKTELGSVHAIFENKTIRVWADTISVSNGAAFTFVGDKDTSQITAQEFAQVFDERIAELASIKQEKMVDVCAK